MSGTDGATVSEIKSAPLAAERENSTLSPGLGPSKALSSSAMDQRAPLTLKQKSSIISSPAKGQASTSGTSNNGKVAGKTDNKNHGIEATPTQTRKRSFLANVTESVLRTFGANGTPNAEAPQKRRSFFALKRSSLIVPGDSTAAGDTEQTESPNSINKSTSSGGSHSSQSRSSVRNSFFDAKQLRSQLAHFLQADEQEQIKHISSGVITIKHGADPSAAIQGGLFSLDGSSISNKNLSAKSAAAVKAANDAAKDAAALVTATADTQTVPRRRYSSLMMSTDSHDDWGDDLLDDPEVLDQLWITKQKQHRHHHHHHRHQQTTPSSSNLLTVKTDDGDGNQSVASKLSLPHSSGGDDPAVTGPLTPTRPNIMSREQSAALIRQLSTSNANSTSISGGHSAVQQYQKIVQSFDHRVGTAQRMVQQQLVR
eukprot:gene12672-9065_t